MVELKRKCKIIGKLWRNLINEAEKHDVRNVKPKINENWKLWVREQWQFKRSKRKGQKYKVIRKRKWELKKGERKVVESDRQADGNEGKMKETEKGKRNISITKW